MSFQEKNKIKVNVFVTDFFWNDGSKLNIRTYVNVIMLLPEADNLFDLFRLYGEGDEVPTNTVDDLLD